MLDVYVEEFTVTEPPTSAEVRRAIACALNSDGVVELTLLPIREIPVPEAHVASIALTQVVRLESGETRARGQTQDGFFATIFSPPDNDEPAQASIVIRR